MDDVFEVLLHVDNYKKLKKGLVRLYKKYVKEEEKKKDADKNGNSNTQSSDRKYLESKIDYLKNCMKKTAEEAKNAKGRFMKENVALLQEINELKKQMHQKNNDIRQI